MHTYQYHELSCHVTPICFVHISPPFLSTWEAANRLPTTVQIDSPNLASGHFSKSQASALAEEHQENIRKPWFLVRRKALGDGHSSLTTENCRW